MARWLTFGLPSLVGGHPSAAEYYLMHNFPLYSPGNAVVWCVSPLRAGIPSFTRVGKVLLSLYYGAMVQYDGLLWLLGGMDTASILYNTVFTSADGVSWSPPQTAPWAPRSQHCACIVQNKEALIVLIGGQTGVSQYSDEVCDASTSRSVILAGPVVSTSICSRVDVGHVCGWYWCFCMEPPPAAAGVRQVSGCSARSDVYDPFTNDCCVHQGGAQLYTVRRLLICRRWSSAS